MKDQSNKKLITIDSILNIDIMPDEIIVSVGDIELSGELKDTRSANKIKETLPIRSEFNTWGDEFYFSIGLQLELDNTAREKVEVGTIGYWPTGEALAIFFGPTPASTDEKPKAASKVNVVGKLKDAEKLKKAKEAGKIKIELK